MKLIVSFSKSGPLAAAMVALIFSACTKSPPAEQGEASEPEPVATPSPAPKPVAQRTIPQATPKAATPEPKRLAPEGTYFLVAGVSVETSDGIVGLRPGTRAVKQADGRFLADGHLVDLKASQYTNDLQVAGRAAHVEKSTQATLVRNSQSQVDASAPAKPAAGDMGTLRDQTGADTNVPEHIAGVNTQRNGLQSSTALGAVHTRTKNGFVWQKTPDGLNWITIKRLDGRPVEPPLMEPVR